MTKREKIPVARLEARVPPDVLALLKRAAEIQGRSLTDFVVTAAHDAAVRAIEQAQIIHLSMKDQQIFAEAIINPPEPTPAMRRAFELHSKLIGSR